MLHVGLGLSRKRVDVCLLSEQGEIVDELTAPFDNDGLCRLPERVGAKFAGPVRAVVESMNGKHLYERLGFRPAWTMTKFLRLPDETKAPELGRSP